MEQRRQSQVGIQEFQDVEQWRREIHRKGEEEICRDSRSEGKQGRRETADVQV